MVEYESNGVGKGFTIFFIVIQTVRYHQGGKFLPATWVYRLGKSFTAFAGLIVIAFYILILKKRDYLGNRSYLKCLPLIGALAIDIAGDVIVYRELGVTLFKDGNFRMELTGNAFGYVLVYVLYSFVAAIRPYKPVEDSKNTVAQP